VQLVLWLKKPDATTIISRENYKEIVYPLPVSSLLFAGKAATEALGKLGIFTIGQLASFNRERINDRLGKLGAMLHDYANGSDDSPVSFAGEEREAKSIGNGMTFKRDLAGLEDITSGVLALSDTVAARLRKHGLKCSAVQVMIRDPQFKTISRQKQLKRPTYLSKDISGAAIEIIKASWAMGAPIRMLTITGLGLSAQGSGQLSFFDDNDETSKQEAIERAIDGIRDKYGTGVIFVGTNLNNDIVAGRRKPEQKEE
jgi:DNA polymerase-4